MSLVLTQHVLQMLSQLCILTSRVSVFSFIKVTTHLGMFELSQGHSTQKSKDSLPIDNTLNCYCSGPYVVKVMVAVSALSLFAAWVSPLDNKNMTSKH